MALLSVMLSGGASAQALGTMQVTARVLPAGPSWAGLATAQTLAQEILSHPSEAAEVRRDYLTRASATISSAEGSRRVLVTIDYPRN